MIKLSNKDIIDVLPYDNSKAVLVEKRSEPDPAHFKVSYYVIDFKEKTKEVLTKSAYILKKFGASCAEIIKTIPNFVQCSCAVLYDKRVLVVYPNGETGLFERNGELSWSGVLKYHESTVCGLALDGKYFWTLCPEENCIIRYSAQNMQSDFIIGGKDQKTFLNPTHISVDEGIVYVCSSGNTVRRIENENFRVSDYLRFNEPILQFYKFGIYSIAVLQSGTYLLENNE